MTLTIPLVAIVAIVAYACYRYMGTALKFPELCPISGDSTS
jgi:hypothetical protein